MKLFIRQSFTQADEKQQLIIQKALDGIVKAHPDVEFITGNKALNKNSFKGEFEKLTNLDFTAKAFREYRLNLIDQCDAMIFIRTSMSESGSYELAYNIHSNSPKPVFYAYWIDSPINTTLLRELDQDYPVVYKEFSTASDIYSGIKTFFEKFNLLVLENI